MCGGEGSLSLFLSLSRFFLGGGVCGYEGMQTLCVCMCVCVCVCVHVKCDCIIFFLVFIYLKVIKFLF